LGEMITGDGRRISRRLLEYLVSGRNSRVVQIASPILASEGILREYVE